MLLPIGRPGAILNAEVHDTIGPGAAGRSCGDNENRGGWSPADIASDSFGGIKRRSCLLLIMVTMAGFVGVLAITMARGLKIDCGCGLFFQRQVGWAVLLEDTLLFLVTAGLYWWELPGVEEVKE